MKSRVVPPDLFESRELRRLPLEVKWTLIGLRFVADDWGRAPIEEWEIKALVWPERRDIGSDEIVDLMLALDEAGEIGIYHSKATGQSYFQLRAWPAVQHKKNELSRYPEPPADLLARFAGIEPESFRAWEGEGESGGEGVSGTPAAAASLPLPPPPFCKVHMPAGTEDNCRACGNRRMQLQHWGREQLAIQQDVQRGEPVPAPQQSGPVFVDEEEPF